MHVTKLLAGTIATAASASCGGTSQLQGTSAVATNENTPMLQQLLARIDELGGEDAYPVVPLDLFFESNDDPASFAPNLDPHPGIESIHRVLRSIEERPDVSAVVVQIAEVLDPPDWPYASSVCVITSADAADVHEWATSLEPDEFFPDAPENYGWGEYAGRSRETPPPGAPAVPAGHRPVI